jgi:hypothetical protein
MHACMYACMHVKGLIHRHAPVNLYADEQAC